MIKSFLTTNWVDRMKLALVFFSMVVLSGCGINSLHDENIRVLQEIANEYYTDKFIVVELMGVYTEKAKKDVDFILEIVYLNSHFEQMVKEEAIDEHDVAFFREQIRMSNNREATRLKSYGTLTLHDLNEIIKMNKQNKLKGISAIHPYYMISEPLVNKNRDKVLLSIHEMIGAASSGRMVIFQKRERRWKIIFEEITWVS